MHPGERLAPLVHEPYIKVGEPWAEPERVVAHFAMTTMLVLHLLAVSMVSDIKLNLHIPRIFLFDEIQFQISSKIIINSGGWVSVASTGGR